MFKRVKLIFTGIVFILFLSLLLNLSLTLARTKASEPTTAEPFSLQKPLASPCVQQRTHRVAKYCFTLTNWGFIGSQAGRQPESEGGCFMPTCGVEISMAPSFHFPCGTELDYLFQGALWIGAVVEGETLVSVGADGWLGVYETFPGTEEQGGCIKEKTIRPSTPCCNPPDTVGAVSEQDIIAIYSDTMTAGVRDDDYDKRAHKPIGIQIEQRSYSWSYDYAEDFALIDFTIKNIGEKDVKGIWMGIYIDADVYHTDNGTGFRDDIAGYRATYPSPLWPDTLAYQDTINIAWIADDDGDLVKGVVGPQSVTSVTGVRVVRAPTENISFNWWMSEGNDPANLDWGPHKQANWDLWKENYGVWCEGGKGTPCGDKAKYFIMSNQEWDYDQIYACIDESADGWLKPPEATFCGDMANGYDTRYLFSFGPIPFLAPGDSSKVTVGYVAGENFHTKVNPINPNAPSVYYNNLDFTDFATNARWAGWVYDNPGVDTPDPITGVGDGDSGKCFQDEVTGECLFYYEGDGVPDFKGPPPPNPPFLSFDNGKGFINVRWNGEYTEQGVDPFTGARDFEGYRIYMSYTGLPTDWTLLASYDYIDYRMWWLKPRVGGHEVVWLEEGIKPDTIEKYFGKELLDILEMDPNYYTEFSPWVYPDTAPPVQISWYEINPGDSLFFALQDWNKGLRDLRVYKDHADSVERGLIPVDSIYYECEYTQAGLLPSFPVWISVTGFDFGDAKTSLGGLEASRSINAKLVYPVDPTYKVRASGEEVFVLPNPYKISENYQRPPEGLGLEEGSGQFDKRIFFHNLRGECTIRIYTLDGDLVQEIEHRDPDKTVASWNLINRNTQAIVSGIYLYSIESKWGNQVGKFVIIK